MIDEPASVTRCAAPFAGRSGSGSRVLRVALVAMMTIGCAESSGPAAVGPEKFDDPEVQRILDVMTKPEKEPPAPRVWPDGGLFDPDAARKARKDEAGNLWKRFRAAHPLGFQGIAISDLREDGTLSVMVSEPPPHVRFEQLGALIQDATIMRQPVGHDGVLFDVVGNLGGGEDEVWKKLRLLNYLLFGTEHGAFVYREPFKRSWQETGQYALDIRARASELQSWVHAHGASFVPVDGGEAIGAASLLQSKHSGVYQLVDGDVIAWWIPADVPVSDCLTDIRVFAIESDLIIGALKEPGGILILGRWRAAPYELLPPLRAETVALLASVSARDELQQSYQRNNPGAGPYTARWDWAPILLSPELVDSEYGDLLNAADQLLKGWTQHGEITYERFDYPPPARWAFPRPLSLILKEKFHQSRLTFNWNTTGAGYVVPFGASEVYALFRTGTLPVSYIPGEDPALAPEVAPYEDAAYDWYAELNNPTLVRVVQYAAIYQIFHNFGKSSGAQEAPANNRPAAGFARSMESFWPAVRATGLADLEALADDPALNARMSSMGDGKAIVPATLLVNGLLAWRSLSDEDRDLIEAEGQRLQPRLGAASALGAMQAARPFLATIAARTRLAERYSGSVSPTGRSWIHTQVIVTSHADMAGGGVGGHNVRASILKLGLDSEMKVGEVAVRNERLLLNAQDIDRAPSIVRTAARGIQAKEAPAILEARLSRMIAEAPKMPLRAAGDALRVPKSGARLPLGRSGLAMGERAATLPPGVGGGNHVTLVKSGDHFLVCGPNKLPPIATSNLADASELASLRLNASTARGVAKGSRNAELELHNLSEVEQSTLLKEVQASARRKGYSQDIVAAARREGGIAPRLQMKNYDFSKARITIGDIKIIDGKRWAPVRVELPPVKTGIRAALIEFWVSFKGAIGDFQVKNILKAIDLRVRTVMGQVRAGATPGEGDPIHMLHQEIKRLGDDFGVEIKTNVTEASGTWQLTLRESIAAPAGARVAG